MDRITEKIEYLMEKRPEKVLEFAKKIYEHEPHLVMHLLETFEDEGHITNKHKYEELIDKVKWANGSGKGQRWEFEDIKKLSKIDFANVDYTEFDFAYLVNMLYAKCCKEFSDMSLFIKLAKCLLEDKDEETKVYKGAYSKKHHQSRGIQDYYNDYRNNYDDYEEENRRGRRRYRSEREEYNNDSYNNDYENRRSYNSSQNRDSFFRQY